MRKRRSLGSRRQERERRAAEGLKEVRLCFRELLASVSVRREKRQTEGERERWRDGMMAVEEEDLLFIFLNLSPCLCKQRREVEGSRVLHRGMSGMATK